MNNLLKQLARRLGLSPSSPDLESVFPPDVTEREREIIRAVRPYTMTGIDRMISLIRAVTYLSENQIPGDLVECGVWRGGSSMALALTLSSLNDTGRTLWLYDTFEGMPVPGREDRSYDGKPASEQMDQEMVRAQAGLEDVQRNLGSTKYDPDRIRYIVGQVEETIPRDLPKQIALLRLDTDWYSSTHHELTHLYPLLSLHGFLIIDDYGHWAGARKATDEYFAARKETPFLHRVDYTGRITQKEHV